MKPLVTLALVLRLIAAPETGQLPQSDPATVRAVQSLFDASEGELETLEIALSELRAGALPVLLTTLATGSYLSSSDGEAPSLRTLTSAERRATLHAMARMPRSAVRAFLSELTALPLPSPLRLSALQLAGTIGRAEDLPLVAELAQPFESEAQVDLQVQHAAQEAFGRIFAADETAAEETPPLFARTPDHVRAPLVLAMVRAGAAGVPALGRMLGMHKEFDGLLLLELNKLSALDGSRADELVRDKVRAFLHSSDERLVRLTVPIVANLRDDGATWMLIGLLDQSPPDLRPRLHLALQAVTGLRLKDDARVWETWLRTESEWYSRESARVFAELDSAHPGRVAQALLEIGKHRLHHESLTKELLPVLMRPEPELVTMAAATLGRLGSRSSVPYLLDGLASSDAGVRTVCADALGQITGKILPPDPAAWVGVVR